MNLRYFDHNATTPLADAAREAWLDASQKQWLNPSSPYRAAAAVRVRYEAARESLAERFGLAPGRVVFTSGATEANNVVIRHWAEALPAGARVGINPTEHPSVIEAAKALLGERIYWLPLTKDGLVEINVLGELVSSGKLAAVSVMAANNETGVIQPWQAIAELCGKAQIPYHCDASQWVGKMPEQGLPACSYVTACAHKFGGSKGVGFLLLPSAEDACRSLLGGAQESGHRAGTEDVAGVLAMIAALEHSKVGDTALRDAFIDQITSAIPGVVVVAAEAPRLWNTVSIIMPQHPSVRWIRFLEKSGFLLSAGSACSTGKSTLLRPGFPLRSSSFAKATADKSSYAGQDGGHAASPVLLEMGIDAAAAARVLRISAGGETTAEDWESLADAMSATYQALNDEARALKSTVISID